MSDKKNNSEIDLIVFFNYLGNVLLKIFRPLSLLFVGLKNACIAIAKAIVKNFIPVVIIGIVFGVIGGVLYKVNNKVYSSELIVKPNYGAVLNLYQTVAYLDALADVKDSLRLSKELNISVAQAATIVKVEVEPVFDNLSKFAIANNLIQEIDSSTVQFMNMQEALEDISITSFPVHKMIVFGEDFTVFPKLTQVIKATIENQEIYKDRRETKIKSLNYRRQMLMEQRVKLDAYQTAVTTEVLEKYKVPVAAGTTNINMAAQGDKALNPADLFVMAVNLDKELFNIEKEIQNADKVLEILSPFKAKSKDVRINLYLFIVFFGLAGVSIYLGIIFLLRLGRFVNQLG